MTESEVRKLIAVMTAALPREWSFLTREQQQATEGVYVRMLTDLPYQPANAGVEALLATATKMPTIADVRGATLRAMHGEVRPGGDAWGDVQWLLAYRDADDLDGIDPIALHVCERMGWLKYRNLWRNGADVRQVHVDFEGDAADRARFVELYDKLVRAHRHEMNVSQLPAAQRYRALQAAEKPQIADGAREANGPRRVAFARLLPAITDGEDT